MKICLLRLDFNLGKLEFKLPKRYNFAEVQAKLTKFWNEKNIYKFNIKDKHPIYSIDTPPPFTSGVLHMGHILNHTWIDLAARFKRMRGYNVYFPQGFDCHGLPTELKVEKEYKISKDDRSKFLEKCYEWTNQAIKQMRDQFDDLGYSSDWDYTYRTMDEKYLRMVQRTLLFFYEKKWLFQDDHPIHWCTNCQTALAKQEVGYVDKKGKLWFIKLPLSDGSGHATIATTRPELMSSCVAVLIHPDDNRHYHLSNKKIKLPIFGREVPIYQDSGVDIEFGTGIVYVCTYGDETDINWQKTYNLPVIISVDEKGFMTSNAGKYQGLSIVETRKNIIEDLKNLGLLEKEESFEHRVIVHTERSACMNPIEYLPIKQWFISIRPFKEEIYDAALKMNWYPQNMIKRLQDWIESLDWDWVISRQRVFGTPIPFWTCQKCDNIIAAREQDLPIDPRDAKPPIDKCPKCSGTLVGVTDVCDCWIDSSITPLVIAKWREDDEFFKKTYPSALRPQGYEIIRTWAFYTIFRCLKLTGIPCFQDLMINGMVAGTDGRKMSKSYGNVVSPDETVKKYGTDALRQWGALGSLGDDYPFNFKEIEYGLRFNTKLWNACRFSSGHLGKFNKNKLKNRPELSPIDKDILHKLDDSIKTCTEAFENYNFHAGLNSVRTFFWHDFCDNYLEAVKYRFYTDVSDNQKLAGLFTVYSVILDTLKMLAPVMPFITEEIYQLLFKDNEKIESIHHNKWPKLYEIEENVTGNQIILIIKDFRNQKASKQIPLNLEIEKAHIKIPHLAKEQVEVMKEDISKTLKIANLEIKSEETNEKYDDTFNIGEIIINWNVPEKKK
ncbi:MAG: valine--tRNA ligase [Candidatus Lokiarchaeota archaeon]|nr:valine--tRNA ligase [Candidatus Lokiarchaeota archaeon]